MSAFRSAFEDPDHAYAAAGLLILLVVGAVLAHWLMKIPGPVSGSERALFTKRGIVRFGSVDMAEEAVGHAFHLFVRGTRRQDSEVAIDLTCVGVDHDGFAAGLGQCFCERDGQCALAACGRSGNKRHRRPPGLVG